MVGVELRGMAGPFHGVRGKKGTFLVTVGENEGLKRVL